MSTANPATKAAIVAAAALCLGWSPAQAADSAPQPARLTQPASPLGPIDPLEARLHWRVAQAFAALGGAELAAHHYRRAAEFGLRGPELWAALGDALLYTGDLSGAEEAWTRAIATGAGRSQDASRKRARARSQTRLGELHLHRRDVEGAVSLFEAALETDGTQARTRRLLARSRHQLQPETEVRPALPVMLFENPAALDWRNRGADVLFEALASLPLRQQQWLHGALQSSWKAGTSSGLAVLAFCLALIAVLANILRGHGNLAVTLDYPPELRGTFTLRLSRRSGRQKRSHRATSAAVLKGGSSAHDRHYLVSRETHFRRVRPGRYFVSVEGILQDPDTEEVLADPFAERPVQVRRGQSRRLELDFRPAECPLDVNVLWDTQPARDAGVVASNLPGTLRYARGGSIRMHLPAGRHTIVVGSGDRVAASMIEVGSYKPERVSIDLAGGADVIFKGCPPAVEPYLHGDLKAAARALEREGQSQASHLLLAQLQQEQGRLDLAAEHFESAGHAIQAGELHARQGDLLRAAELFQAGGDAARSASSFERCGEMLRAGAAYQSARDFENAVRCYRSAGAVAQWVDVLEQAGQVFQAAKIALEHDLRRRAIRLLQQVLPEDPDYSEACLKLAAALEREGHVDLAIEKLDEHIANNPESSDPGDRFHLSELLEKCGEVERAIDALEALRQREPTYPHVASRIETLRKQLSAAELAKHSAGSGTGGLQTTSPLLRGEESRYEILEEIGRGGMGVVYRAHDRRLNREVALKRMPENMREHPKALRYFLREAQAVARLNHPNIVTIYDVDEEDGTFFITMELLKGQPLNAVLRKMGRIGARDAARIGIQVAAGLARADEAGIVHRDIKTANLFVTVDKTITIMDFGLAKMVQEVRRGSTVIGGTPFYMAPEQAAGEPVDHRTDLYSLGVTLFELVTGRLPFSDGDIAYQHRHTPPPEVRSLAPDVPELLADLIASLLRKDPEERPSSARQVWKGLEAVLESTDASATPRG